MTDQKPFAFQREEDGSLTASAAIGQAIEAASKCLRGSPRLVEIADTLERELIVGIGPSFVVEKSTLDEHGVRVITELKLLEVSVPSVSCKQSHLGMASTRELIDELRARFEVHAKGGLDYRTVGY